MGGARCGGGCRCGGPVGYIFVLGNRGIHFLYWRYVGEKLSQIFSNLHFFCKILQKISGVPDAAGLSDTFLVLEILVEKKLSQIISFFLKFSRNTFLCIGNGGKLSQIISFFLKFSQNFSNFLKLSQNFSFVCFKLSQFFQPNICPKRWGPDRVGGTGREWLSDTIFVLVAYREKM